MEELLKKWNLTNDQDQLKLKEKRERKKSTVDDGQPLQYLNYLTYQENLNQEETFVKMEATSRVKKLIERLKKPETIDVHSDVT